MLQLTPPPGLFSSTSLSQSLSRPSQTSGLGVQTGPGSQETPSEAQTPLARPVPMVWWPEADERKARSEAPPGRLVCAVTQSSKTT